MRASRCFSTPLLEYTHTIHTHRDTPHTPEAVHYPLLPFSLAAAALYVVLFIDFLVTLTGCCGAQLQSRACISFQFTTATHLRHILLSQRVIHARTHLIFQCLLPIAEKFGNYTTVLWLFHLGCRFPRCFLTAWDQGTAMIHHFIMCGESVRVLQGSTMWKTCYQSQPSVPLAWY